MYPRDTLTRALLGVLLLTVLAYAPLRRAGWVYEDSNAVFANPVVAQGQAIAVDRARWLSALSHRIVWTVAGDRPVVHHAVNLALHLTNGVLVFAIAGVFLAPVGALGAAALFLLHPLQVEAVAYVASRSELLATCFALVAFWRALTARRLRDHVIVWGAVAAAVCAKESAAVIVPIIALTDVFRGRRLSAWRLTALLVPVALMAVSVLVRDYLSRSEFGPIDYAATQAYAVWRYLGLLIVPIGQTVDHDVDVAPWALRYLALYGSVAIVAVALLASTTAGDETHTIARIWDGVPSLRLVAFGVAWLTIALAPRFVMRVPEVLNEHQTYLPFIGAWIICGAGVSHLWGAPHATPA